MGKTKGKILNPGPKMPRLSYKNDAGEKVEIAFDQPFAAELGIATGTRVSFDIINMNKLDIAVAVCPVNNGVIAEIDFTNGTGFILETESQIKYPFVQNYLEASNIALGSNVKYTLVCSNNTVYAACLSLAQ